MRRECASLGQMGLTGRLRTIPLQLWGRGHIELEFVGLLGDEPFNCLDRLHAPGRQGPFSAIFPAVLENHRQM